MLAQPAVHDVGVHAVPQSDRCYGGTSLAALADSLAFELWTVKPTFGDFGASIARHGVHDLHRAHYRRGSAAAQYVLAGRLRGGCGQFQCIVDPWELLWRSRIGIRNDSHGNLHRLVTEKWKECVEVQTVGADDADGLLAKVVACFLRQGINEEELRRTLDERMRPGNTY